MGQSKPNPRRHNSAARERSRKRLAAMGAPCAICGRPIDYSRPARVRVNGKWVWDDWSFELDEIVPVALWEKFGYPSPEACANDPANHQATHRLCNRQKGARYIGGKPPAKAAKPAAKQAAKRQPRHSRNW